MDPTTCYNDIIAAIMGGEYEEARLMLDDLTNWIERGGFLPNQLAHLKRGAALISLNLMGAAAETAEPTYFTNISRKTRREIVMEALNEK